MSDINKYSKLSNTYKLIFTCILILFLFSGCDVFNRGRHYTYFVGYQSPDVKGLGTAFAIYMNDHDGKVPDTDKWCDELIIHADMTPADFVPHYQNFELGETTLALNNAGIDENSPAGLVMLFEAEDVIEGQVRDFSIEQREFMAQDTEGRFNALKGAKVYKDLWNISGGPEKLLIRPGYYKHLILYADSHVKYVSSDELKKLQWDQENTDYSDIIQSKIDKADLMVQDAYHKASYIAHWVFGISLLFLFMIPRKLSCWANLIMFCVVVGIISFILGGISHMIHKFFDNGIVGDSIGLWCGLASSIVFCAIIFNIPAKMKSSPVLFLFTVMPGMIFGGLCSAFVHCTIVSITGESFQNGVLPGLIFGISAGAMIGVITAGFIKSEAIIESTEQIPL